MSVAASGMRLEVQVNGDRAATVGLGGDGVLSAIVTWVRRSTPRSAGSAEAGGGGAGPSGALAHDTEEEVAIEIAGLDGEARHHLTWLEQPLAVGDEVTVRILPPGDCDKPTVRWPMDEPRPG